MANYEDGFGTSFAQWEREATERSQREAAERSQREAERIERCKKEKERKIKRNGRIIKICLLVLLVLVCFFSSFYTVSETEQAIVERFGAYQKTELAGPHFHLPFIEGVRKVSTANRFLTVGYVPETNENILEESKMITGDNNIANIDFYVVWRVLDGYNFLYNSEEPEAIFKSLIQSAARSVIGSQRIDDVLTSGKIQIQSDIKDRILAGLEEYSLGITLVDLIIQDAEPADNEYGQVTAAFKDVENAKQEQERLENEGYAYSNREVPKAKAEADKIERSAEAYKEARIAQANGEVAEFVAMYEEYSKNPEIVKERMFLEMIEKVYPELDLFIDTSDSNASSNILKLLPLEVTSNAQ